MPKSTKFNRLIVAGIAAAAIAPTAAVARPAIDGGGATSQNLTAPDQVDRVTGGTTSNGAPQWPVDPRPIPNRFVATTNTPSTDGGGIDDGVLIALGGGALLLVVGVGAAGRKRLRIVRQRQPA
jgi:hypothetical protein